MDARGALLIGSATAVAASVAVASAVALTSAAALADRPGRALADSAVVVQGHASAAPRADVGAPPVAAETVPAPEPREIVAPGHHEEAKTAPVVTDQAAPPGAPATSASPTPAPTRAADARPGKSRAPAFRQPFPGHRKHVVAGEHSRRHLADGKAHWRRLLAQWRLPFDRGAAPGTHRTPADEAGNTSGPESPRVRSGFQREQSHRSPDRRD